MMVRKALLLAALLLPAAPAEACSFSWGRGRSPAEIRENPALRRVTGTFRFILNPENGHVVTDARGHALGRIENARGRPLHWDTFQTPLYEVMIECGAYTAPTGNDSTGTFWISRERRRGRYRLMLWEAHYPPPDPAAAATP